VNRVAVSVLNFKSAPSTIACVRSLLIAAQTASKTCRLEIFVADNASGSEEQQQLQLFLNEFENTHFQVNTENLGFSAGHNRNLQSIFNQSSPDFVWLLNNDCMVAGQSLAALVDHAKLHPEVGIWGATLIEPDGETIQCAGGCFYNSWVSSYRQYGRGKKRYQLGQLKAVKYDYIAGASMFFPVATLHSGLRPLEKLAAHKTGGQAQWLNEIFFLYFEELDLAKRLRPGIGLGWCREALISHESGASTGTSGDERSTLAEYHSTLSALKFTRCYYPFRLWVMAPVRYISKCLLLMLRGDFRLIGAVTKAFWDFWTSRMNDFDAA